MTQLLTKSLFTTSLGCPRKLYYATHSEQYDNANSDNDFLRSLAEGGIQVGALARHYYKSPFDKGGFRGNVDALITRKGELFDSPFLCDSGGIDAAASLYCVFPLESSDINKHH